MSPWSGARVNGKFTDESGFTLIELLVALMVMSLGIMSLVGTMDTSRDLGSHSERIEAATHIGQQEMDKVHALAYKEVALASAPTHSTDTAHPFFYVDDGDPPRYHWDQKDASTIASSTEPLVVDSVEGRVDPGPSNWNDGRLRGTISRFITWVNDPQCGPDPDQTCPGDQDYKRVTIAVRVEGENGKLAKPVLITSAIVDPDTGSAGPVLDGKLNPLTDPSTRCIDDDGDEIECVSSIGTGNGLIYYLYDTPSSFTSRRTITGDHPTHATVAPSDPNTCKSGVTTGCPVPDLMGPFPPTAATNPPLYRYSTDMTGGYIGGAAKNKKDACSGQPPKQRNTEAHMWVTPPLMADQKLSGNGGATMFTQTVDGVTATAELCMVFYDVTSTRDLTSGGAVEIGRASYNSDAWPTTTSPVPGATTPISFSFDFRSGLGDVRVVGGHRIGVVMWMSSQSQADVAWVYDHPRYPSSLLLNTASEDDDED